ncbi:UNVERIFIED_CONTAM: 2S seed storage protein 1 [Sesamum latifolium]|uniref:2S seed storage protein 1 n=1 Tax=Sesamum latifolium TaxID=2727402 RepID=A0AAW2WPK1_9LAMI
MQLLTSTTNTFIPPPPLHPHQQTSSNLHYSYIQLQMTRFTVVLAVLFLMAAACASAHKMVVTTSVAEEEENQPIEAVHAIYAVAEGPYEESFVRSAVANQGRSQEQLFRECCDELADVKSYCRCEALKCVMRQMQEEHGMEQQIRREMRYLPHVCGMSYPVVCHM